MGVVKDIRDVATAMEAMDGIDLLAMPAGSVVQFKTLNSTYTCRKIEGHKFSVEGGRYLYEPTEVNIAGSKFTFWGSMLHVGFLDVGGYVEIYVLEGPHKGNTLTTTEVRSITNL